MKEKKIETATSCPNCKSNKIKSSKILVKLKTGLKTSNNSLIWGIILTILGFPLLILGGYSLYTKLANPAGFLVIGSGLIFGGLGLIQSFVSGKKAPLYYYLCTECSHKWARLGGEGNSSIIKPFLSSIQGENEDEKFEALKIISNIGDSRFVPSLKKNLYSTNSIERSLALKALSVYKNQDILDLVIKALNDEELDIRVLAVKSLGMYKFKKSIKPLISSLDDEKREVRNWAIDSLQKLTGKRYASISKWKSWWEDNSLE